MAPPSDTSPAAEQFLIAAYRRMTAAEKLSRVSALNRLLAELATARLRAQYGQDISPGELRLRLAALRLDAEVMRDAFHWDPARHGL